MALIRCKECRTRVSTTASACPKCGATGGAIAPKEPTAADKIAAKILVAILALWGGAILYTNGQEQPTSADIQAKLDRQQPEKALARALEHKPEDWLDKLEELKPNEHARIVADIDASVERIYQEVLAISASDLKANMLGYARLVALQPDNELYDEKFRHYRSELWDVQEEERSNRRCQSDQRQLSYSAVGFSRSLVKAQLKSPRSANFNGPSQAQYLGNCEFSYTASVDSQNSFGAMIRTNFTVRAKAVGSSWVLTDISL